MNVSRFSHAVLFSLFYLVSSGCWSDPKENMLPEGFVYIEDVIPDISTDLRYYSSRNFIGEPIVGYESGKAILSLVAVKALEKVQNELKPFGLGLKIFDAYRPQRAVDFFVKWMGIPDDIRMKAEYYPGEDKSTLIKEGYIAAKSSHSRGSTVDLTIISRQTDSLGLELDMGSNFDFFGRASWSDYQYATPDQRANRMLLQQLMMKHGFMPFPMEWWHFALRNEPFPDQYFDFPVN